jgi:dTDP-4-amino-4,6-dideoxygalactose transaminase
MGVPLFATSIDEHKPRLAEKLAEVVDGGRYILGPEVEAFEREFAAYLGAKHCVGVANGTDAITIALRALGVGPGDEVVCPSYTFYASVEATISSGATPVFCDIDPATGCVTPETVKAAITSRTKVLMPVHLYGNVAPVEELRDLGLPILEDAAQAAGARLNGGRAGALGDAATFSFFPSKNLPCLGDGGAVVTNDDDVAKLARRLRFHGSDDKQTFVEVGYNSRLDELQAAVLRILLPELDGWNAARREAAAAYERLGLGDHVALPRPVDGAEHVYHLFVVRSERASELAATLAERNIGVRRYYEVPVHRQPATERYAGGELPGTDEAARTGLALPMGTGLTEEAVREVVEACASGST